MDSLKRNHAPAVDKMEEFLKKHKYQESLTDFETFWSIYKEKESKSAPFQLKDWLYQAGLAAASIAVVFIAIIGFSHVSRSIQSSEILSWNKVSGNGVRIGVNNGAAWQVVKNTQQLTPGTIIRTDVHSEADFTIKKIMRLKLYPDSYLKIGNLKEHASFDLSLGKLAYLSGKLGKGQTVNISTPLLNIEVTGTMFLVSVSPEQNCRIAVSEGSVRITPIGYLFSDAVMKGILSENRVRQLTAQVMEKSGFAVPQSVDLDAKNEMKFYRESADIIRKNLSDINRGNTVPSADKIASLFRDMVAGRAHFAETTVMDRRELAELSADRQAKQSTFQVLNRKKMAISGRESEILELPEGRQCFTVDRTVVYLSSTGDIEKTVAVDGSKLILTRPELAGELVVMGSDVGGLYAFDLKGSPVWTKEDSGIQVLNAFPVSCGRLIAVPTVDKGLRFFDRNGAAVPSLLDGRNEGLFSSPMYLQNGGVILFGNEKGDFTAFEPEKNRILWSRNIIQDVSVYNLTGDMRIAVIVARKSGDMVAIRPSDGSVIWSRGIKEASKTRTNPTVFGSRLAISGEKDLFVLDMTSGRTISKKTFQSKIITMKWFQGKVLVGDEKGGLYLFDISAGKANEIYHTKGPVERISVNGNTVTVLSDDELVRLKIDELES